MQGDPDEGRYAVLTEGMSVADSPVTNLSLHVPYGSVYGLVGPSGSGKTVTLQALATLRPIRSGSVWVAEYDIRSDPGSACRYIGYQPDLPGLYNRLTVGESMEFYCAIQAVPSRQRPKLIADLLELFNLTALRGHPAGSLSRGERQRLSLARCLVHDPAILLLDDPTAFLDSEARAEFRDVLTELRSLGKTILLTTHVLAELASTCTHLGILNQGQLAAEGPVEEVTALLSPATQVRVRVAEPSGRHLAERLLAEHPACLSVEEVGSTLVAAFAGSEGDLPSLLRHLIAAGVPVTSFEGHSLPLDDVVLRAGESDTV